MCTCVSCAYDIMVADEASAFGGGAFKCLLVLLLYALAN